MNYHNSMERLAAIVSIMIVASNYYPGNFVNGQVLNPSVKEISRALKIPVSVIHNDMLVLIKNPQLRPYLWCYESANEKEEERKKYSQCRKKREYSFGKKYRTAGRRNKISR